MNAGKKIVRYHMLILTLIFSKTLIIMGPAIAFSSEMPGKNFACQVYHPNEESKVSLVQANSKKEALEVIYINARSRNKNVKVNECILIGKEQFKDPFFQKKFDKMPR